MPILASSENVTIAAGQSASGAMAFDGQNLALWVPLGWTAAALAIQAARVPGTPVANDWHTVTDLDGEVSLPAAALRVVIIPASLMIPNVARWVRFISGTVAAPVNQVAERVIPVERRSF